MEGLRLPCVLFLAAANVLVFVPHHAAVQDQLGAVFTMTNAVSNNQINVYTRREGGSLEFSAAFPTGGMAAGAPSIRCIHPILRILPAEEMKVQTSENGPSQTLRKKPANAE